MILEQTAKLIFQIIHYHKILPPKVNRIVVGSKYTGVEVLPMGYDPIVGLAYTMLNIRKEDSDVSIEKYSLVDLIKWSFEPIGLKKL